MIKRMLFLFLIIFFFIAIIKAFDLSYTGNIVKSNFNTMQLLENTDSVVNDYNKNFENIPQFARTLLGSERINMVISLKNGSKVELGLVTKEGKVLEYYKRHLENPTIYLEASEQVMDSIASSKIPAKDFETAIKNKSIVLRPYAFSLKLKVYAAKAFIKIKNLF